MSDFYNIQMGNQHTLSLGVANRIATIESSKHTCIH